jgi:hypothetical protein
MEARVAVLEEIASATKATLAELKSGQDRLRDELRTGLDAARDRQERDFRLTFGALIGVALGLAAIMAKGFKWF